MIQNNKILLSGKTRILKLSLVAVLSTTALFAFGNQRDFDNCDSVNTNMKQMSNLHSQNDSLKYLMMTLSEMDLSSNQWKEIRKIMFELREKRLENFDNKTNVILIDSAGNFNKDDFIRNRTTLSKNMIELQSNAIENILKILDETQRKSLASKLNS